MKVYIYICSDVIATFLYYFFSTRIAYDRVAQLASKRITQVFRKMMRKLHLAAQIIQQNYRIYVSRRDNHLSRSVLKATKAYMAVKNKLKRILIQRDLTRGPDFMALVERRFDFYRKRKVTRWLIKCVKRIKRGRGMRKRQAICAKKIQSLFRGKRARKMVSKL